ncbi:hypothetical protein [Rhizobium sp. BR 315]
MTARPDPISTLPILLRHVVGWNGTIICAEVDPEAVLPALWGAADLAA